MTADEQVTQLLQRLREGDDGARRDLYPLVYARLRELAGAQMRNERANHTLQPTALVNEAYLKLVDQTHASFNDRGHFMAVAATAMRRVLIDHARGKSRAKRGGAAGHRVTLDGIVAGAEARGIDLLALDDALEQLSAMDERKARIVELRFFAGLSVAESAAALGVSEKTVKREWAVARGWLRRALDGGEDSDDE